MSGFRYRVYRLNIEHTAQGELLDPLQRIETDEDIWLVLNGAADSQFDTEDEGKTKIYKWSIRSAVRLEEVVFNCADIGESDIIAITLARSTIQQPVDSVTDDGLVRAQSRASPPPAVSMRLIFIQDRHLVLTEYDSTLSNSSKWQALFSVITSKCASNLGYDSKLLLTNLTSTIDIQNAISTFSVVTRLPFMIR